MKILNKEIQSLYALLALPVFLLVFFFLSRDCVYFIAGSQMKKICFWKEATLDESPIDEKEMPKSLASVSNLRRMLESVYRFEKIDSRAELLESIADSESLLNIWYVNYFVGADKILSALFETKALTRDTFGVSQTSDFLFGKGISDLSPIDRLILIGLFVYPNGVKINKGSMVVHPLLANKLNFYAQRLAFDKVISPKESFEMIHKLQSLSIDHEYGQELRLRGSDVGREDQ